MATTSDRSGTCSQPAAASPGSLAIRTPSGSRRRNRVSPQAVAHSRGPVGDEDVERRLLAARRDAFRRVEDDPRDDVGQRRGGQVRDGLLRGGLVSAGLPSRCQSSSANTAESHGDSAAAEGGRRPRSPSASTRPLWLNRYLPWVKGAVAVSSMGMPMLAERTAATTHPLATVGATEANEASVQIGTLRR